MAMTPEERQRVDELERLVRAMHKAEDIAFIESIARRFVDRGVFLPTNARLSDLADVSGTDSATTGQVLKKTATTWQPGTDIDT